MLQYFPKNYISDYFPKRYFQLLGGEVIVPRDYGGGDISLGKYSPLFDISRLKLLDYVKTTFNSIPLEMSINKVLAKIHDDDDEALLLSLLNLNLQTKPEKENLDYLKIILDLLILIDEEEEGENSDEEERIISLLNTFFMN